MERKRKRERERKEEIDGRDVVTRSRVAMTWWSREQGCITHCYEHGWARTDGVIFFEVLSLSNQWSGRGKIIVAI